MVSQGKRIGYQGRPGVVEAQRVRDGETWCRVTTWTEQPFGSREHSGDVRTEWVRASDIETAPPKPSAPQDVVDLGKSLLMPARLR